MLLQRVVAVLAACWNPHSLYVGSLAELSSPDYRPVHVDRISRSNFLLAHFVELAQPGRLNLHCLSAEECHQHALVLVENGCHDSPGPGFGALSRFVDVLDVAKFFKYMSNI